MESQICLYLLIIFLGPPKIMSAVVRPLFVEILLLPRQLVANQAFDVRCRTAGSHPGPPTITWWKGNKQIPLSNVWVIV